MRIFAPQHTQTPNELFDEWLPKLTFVQLKVLMVIIRKTFGWHKIRDRISISQLEELTGAKRQAILNAAKSLEKMGLITKIVVGSKGQQQTFYELIVIEDSNSSYQCDQHTPTSVIITPTKETLSKEIESPVVLKEDLSSSSRNSRRDGTNPRALGTNPRATGLNPRNSVREEKEEKCPRVWIAPSQEKDLLRRLNGDGAKLNACYDRLSSWKIDKMIEGGKADYKAIINWVMKAVEDDVRNGKGASSENQPELDKQLVEKIKAKIPHHKHIEYGYNYIIFDFGAHNYNKIIFGDKGFKAQVLNHLRKMNISIEGA